MPRTNTVRRASGSQADRRASPADVPLTVTRPALLQDGSDAAFRSLVHDLLAFSTRLEAIRQSFGESIGLTGIQYTILISVLHLQGARGVGVKEVAEHLSLSGAFVTIETGKLLKRGLIDKRTNPDDRRRVLLAVTDDGRDLLARLADVQQQVNDELFRALDAAQFKQLHAMAGGLVDGAKAAVRLSDYLTGRAEAGQK